ncbi:unnamed protein product, partial [Rotaria sp. Silwood2]
FYLEQSRPDRDDYVRVLWENIEPGFEYNFYKTDTGYAYTLNTPYDFGSIMHYGSNYFSVNGADTLEALNSSITFGQRDTLSPYDIQAIRNFYGCSISTDTTADITATTDTTTTSTTTKRPTTTTTSTKGTTITITKKRKPLNYSNSH